MPFQLIEVNTLPEFTTYTNAFWNAYNNPPQPGFDCAALIITSISAAISDLIDRFLTSSKEDPTHYFSIIDTSTSDKKVVGGGCWNVHLENPYAKESDDDRGVYWWPEENDSRKFTERDFMECMAPRLQRHRRLHVRKWMRILIGNAFC